MAKVRDTLRAIEAECIRLGDNPALPDPWAIPYIPVCLLALPPKRTELAVVPPVKSTADQSREIRHLLQRRRETRARLVTELAVSRPQLFKEVVQEVKARWLPPATFHPVKNVVQEIKGWWLIPKTAPAPVVQRTSTGRNFSEQDLDRHLAKIDGDQTYRTLAGGGHVLLYNQWVGTSH